MRTSACAARAHPAKRLEPLDGSLHGVVLVEGSAAIRGLLEAFVRSPAATARAWQPSPSGRLCP